MEGRKSSAISEEKARVINERTEDVCMAYDASFLCFGEKRKAVALVIGILVSEWPLSTAALHKRLAERYSYPISYQGTHKIIKKLAENGVVEKEDRHYYRLSENWLAKIRDFSSDATESYAGETGKLEFPV